MTHERFYALYTVVKNLRLRLRGFLRQAHSVNSKYVPRTPAAARYRHLRAHLSSRISRYSLYMFYSSQYSKAHLLALDYAFLLSQVTCCADGCACVEAHRGCRHGEAPQAWATWASHWGLGKCQLSACYKRERMPPHCGGARPGVDLAGGSCRDGSGGGWSPTPTEV